MATNVLVSELLEESRIRLDYPAFTTTTFVTSAAALSMLKFSARRLSGILRRANSDYFTTTSTVPTVASTATVSLPSNMSDLIQVAWLRSATDSVPLERASVDQLLVPTEDVRAWSGAPLYRLEGNLIRLFPTPDQIYTLSLYYDTGIYVSATSDNIACQPGWDEWLVLDFCIKCRQREEKPADDFMMAVGKLEPEIVRQATTRDRFRTSEIRDLWDGGEWIDSRSLYVRR
jgi:hypothetical protein